MLDDIHHALTLASSRQLTPEINIQLFSDRDFSDDDNGFKTQVLKAWFKYVLFR
jgi:hypothetical protein